MTAHTCNMCLREHHPEFKCSEAEKRDLQAQLDLLRKDNEDLKREIRNAWTYAREADIYEECNIKHADSVALIIHQLVNTIRVQRASAALCALAALCFACSLCAQDDLALVVPDADARELARLQADVDRANAALAAAKERVRKRLHPPDWPCCLVRWSRDYRVMWPEMPTPKWDLTYRDTPLYRPDLITPHYYGTLAK